MNDDINVIADRYSINGGKINLLKLTEDQLSIFSCHYDLVHDLIISHLDDKTGDQLVQMTVSKFPYLTQKAASALVSNVYYDYR